MPTAKVGAACKALAALLPCTHRPCAPPQHARQIIACPPFPPSRTFTDLHRLAGALCMRQRCLQLRHVVGSQHIHPLALPLLHVIGRPGRGVVDGLAELLTKPVRSK